MELCSECCGGIQVLEDERDIWGEARKKVTFNYLVLCWSHRYVVRADGCKSVGS